MFVASDGGLVMKAGRALSILPQARQTIWVAYRSRCTGSLAILQRVAFQMFLGRHCAYPNERK